MSTASKRRRKLLRFCTVLIPSTDIRCAMCEQQNSKLHENFYKFVSVEQFREKNDPRQPETLRTIAHEMKENDAFFIIEKH